MSFAGNQRFELRRELGRGGMGVVYEAFDTERRQPVALKMLHRNDPETIVQLKQEFRSLSEIVHPHLIGMYELLGDEQHWFFTMEFVRDGINFMAHLRRQMGLAEVVAVPQTPIPASGSGAPPDFGASDQTTLRSRPVSAGDVTGMPSSASNPGSDADLTGMTIADSDTAMHTPHAAERSVTATDPRRNLTPDQIRAVVDGFRQLAEGVRGLHAQGKLHRDLKPGNVMFRADGSVVILDFGLAVAKASREATGQSGSTDIVITGTVAYMAPEQAAGYALSEASDWYAVGTMLFEALTGELPFKGTALDILRGKQLSAAPDVNFRASGIPEPLAALCNTLLQRDPAQRPGAQQILAVLDGSDATQAPPEPDFQEHFIGREEYLERLEAAYVGSRDAAVIAHLRARSGTGKSALMAEFVRRLSGAREALIFRSRCYEQESVPYKTVDGLADEIAQWLTARPKAEQQKFVPPAAQALAQIFPVFKRVPAIAAAAAAGRTTDLEELRRQSFEAFGELLRRIGDAHPLVLCIDDLQWGDAEGVEMLAVALTRPGIHLLLIATFREEYAASSACLQALLAFEEKTPSLVVEDIAVKPLTREESLELARRRNPQTSAADLEEIVRQAEGNPYFLEELAHQSGAARALSSSAGLKLDAILWSRIERLSEPELQLLETIAVSGQPIRLRYAQTAAGLRDVPVSLLTSLRMHHLVRSSGQSLQDEVETYHDRIRETVLDHLSRERRRDRHASLAFCLEEGGEATSDTLAVHFEAGEQPEKAGQFYELAAQEAASALAFTRAEEFYKKARRIVSDPAVRTRLTERLIHLNTDLARFPEAYALGREALAELGLKIPAKFFPPAFLADLAQSYLLFRKRKIESILDLPAATDPQHIAQITLLAGIGKAAFQIRPELCIAIMLKIVNASVRRGNARDSAIGYMAVGAIFIGGIMGRCRPGYEFGQASLKLVDKYEATRIRPEVNFVVGYFGISWQRPAEDAEELWKVSHRAGLETGDLFHMGCASCATVMSQFMRGVPFDRLESQAAGYLELLERYGLREPRSAVQAILRTIAALKNSRPDDAAPPSAQPEQEFGSRHIGHYALLVKMQEQYLFGDYQAAIETGKRSAQYLGDSRGMLHGTEHPFWLALAQFAQARQSGSKPPAKLRKDIHRFERWAQGSPANFRARALILGGEGASAAGKSDAALAAFSEAAQTAAEYHQPHLAGLAHRLAAADFARRGRSDDQGRHLALAAEQYRRWGALAAQLQDLPGHDLSTRSDPA